MRKDRSDGFRPGTATFDSAGSHVEDIQRIGHPFYSPLVSKAGTHLLDAHTDRTTD